MSPSCLFGALLKQSITTSNLTLCTCSTVAQEGSVMMLDDNDDVEGEEDDDDDDDDDDDC